LLDLLKRKLNMQTASREDRAGGSHQSTTSPDSSSKGQQCSREGQTTSETCSCERSALSNAEHRAMSSMSSELGQISSDGHAEHRASGSSDGCKTKTVSSNESGCDQHMCRGGVGRKALQTFWRLKTLEEYENDEQKKEPTRSKYFNFNSLEQMIELVPYKEDQSRQAFKREQERRLCFLQFLSGLLQLNPDERWTAKQAAAHPFITQARYDPGFTPPPDEPVPSFAGSPTGAARVPRLDPKAMEPLGGADTGGGSARTSQENAILESRGGDGADAKQPRSAPASTRGVVPAGQGSDAERGPESPEDTSAESWRPPIDKMSEHFFRCVAESRSKRPLQRPAVPSRNQVSGSTGTPASSHGSANVAPACTTGGAVASNALPTQTPHRGTGQGAVVQQHRAASSRDGSRGSSPWHLPSPTSEMSTVSDNNRGSSQMSGSDSCGENIPPHYDGSHCLFNECRTHFEDSHSDTAPHCRSTQHSDSSDCTSPRSHDAAEHARLEEERCNTKDPQHALWENIKSEITRTGLTRRLDIAQSPGTVGAMGNFREAMGMKQTGPVIPHGLGARTISSRHQPRESRDGR